MTRYLTLKFTTHKDLDYYLSEQFPPYWDLHSVVYTTSHGFVVIIQQTTERAQSQRAHHSMVARREARRTKTGETNEPTAH